MIRRANKFHATRTALFPGGRMYDSGAEASYAAQLQLRQKAGDIAELVEQPRLELVPGVFYKPDFGFLDCAPGAKSRGTRVYCDVKGVETERFRIIKRLWALVGPGYLQIVKRGGRRQEFRVTEEIPPGDHSLVLTMELRLLRQRYREWAACNSAEVRP